MNENDIEILKDKNSLLRLGKMKIEGKKPHLTVIAGCIDQGQKVEELQKQISSTERSQQRSLG